MHYLSNILVLLFIGLPAVISQDILRSLPYSFSYKVEDPETNNYQGRAEYKDELGITRGAYYHLGPDDRWYHTIYHDEGNGIMSVQGTREANFPPSEVSQYLFDVEQPEAAPPVMTRTRIGPPRITDQDVNDALNAFLTPTAASFTPRINSILNMLLFPRRPESSSPNQQIFFRGPNFPQNPENTRPQDIERPTPSSGGAGLPSGLFEEFDSLPEISETNSNNIDTIPVEPVAPPPESAGFDAGFEDFDSGFFKK